MIFRTATILAVVGLTLNTASAIPLLGNAGARVVRSCTTPGTAALTFDDGPYEYTREAMKILEDHGAKGTFFVNGNNWGCIYDQAKVDILKETYNRGHQIASHTWSHGHLNNMGQSQLKSELERAHKAIKQITGADVAFMRPPYGEYNDAVRQVASSLGETVVIWDLDSRDSISGTSVEAQKAEYTKAVNGHPSTILSLQHDVHATSIRDVLPFAIDTLQKANYKLVTVAECLGEQPYRSRGKASSRNSEWVC